MKYKLDLSPKLDLTAPAASGAILGAAQAAPFVAWQPSSWPAVPAAMSADFIETLKRIFEDSMLSEINNVIEDVQKCHGDLTYRGQGNTGGNTGQTGLTPIVLAPKAYPSA